MSTDGEASQSVPGNLALRAFGPFADALGHELERLPSFASRNLERLAGAFSRRATQLDQEVMSTRLFKHVIDEASWADDEIVAEYLGGVLAATAKGPVSDSGVVIAHLIKRLSAAQLRAHFLIYSEMRRLRDPVQELDLSQSAEQAKLHLEIDYESFFASMEPSPTSEDGRRTLLDHVILGLAREELVHEHSWNYERGSLHPEDGSLPRRQLSVHPSPLGAELFLWGMGSPVIDQARLFDVSLELVYREEIPPLEGCSLQAHKKRPATPESEMNGVVVSGAFDALLSRVESMRAEHGPHPIFTFYEAVARTGLGEVQSGLELAVEAGQQASEGVRVRMLGMLATLRDLNPSQFRPLLELSVAFDRAAIESVLQSADGSGAPVEEDPADGRDTAEAR